MDLTKQARRTILICALLSGVTLAIFWPVTQHGFTTCDDPAYITLNQRVQQGVTWPGVRWAFGELHGPTTYWHPLTWLSHMLDYQVFGLRPGWHHLVSLLFHVANVVLVFLLMKRLTGASFRSAFVAAVFALHPLQVDSVAWAAERKTLLSAFFFLLAIWAYANYVTGGRCRAPRSEVPGSPLHGGSSNPAFWYVLALALFAMGLMSKPTLVPLPFLLLLLDYWPLGRFRGSEPGGRSPQSAVHSPPPGTSRARTFYRLLLEKVPFLALSAASCLVTIKAHQALGALADSQGLPLPFRLANAAVAYVTYLEKTFWPSGLAIFYPLRTNLFLEEVALAVVVLGSVSVWVLWFVRRSPHLAVGWFWFLGMLVPTIGLVQAGAQQMADRYMYLPLIGLSLMLVWEVAERLGRLRNGRKVLIGAGTATLLACVAVTTVQIGYWRNNEILFQHALEVAKDNYMAHNNLAGDYYLGGRLDDAITHYQASLAMAPLQPHHLEIHYYLGEALNRRDRYTEAAQQFGEVLAVHPDDVPSLVQLGIARAREGKPDEAAQAFSEALRIQPNDPAAHDNFGNLLAQQGRYEQAVQQFELSLKAKPDNAAAHNNLALSLRKLGWVGEAIDHFKEAIRLQPGFLAALNNLAWTLAASPKAQFRKGAEAVRLATQGCELTRYENPMLLATLSAAYAEVGQFPEAISFAERAQGLVQGSQGPMGDRLTAMLAAFRANRAYHAD